jgi:hypothetical protein
LGIIGVQFQLDGAPLGTEDTAAPYSVAWDTTTVSDGTHTLTAVARDGAHNRTTAAPVSVRVSNDTTAPTVTLTAPAAGSTVFGTITVSAAASDNRAVVGVQFQLDGAPLGAEDTTAPYSVSWNTATASAGAHTLTAVARDAGSNRATSAPVTVRVSRPPTVTLTSPAAGSTVTGTITVSATASDDIGVVGVQFLIDGTPLGAEDTTSPYSIAWNTITANNGTRILTAVARDADNSRTTSAPVTVIVSNDSIAPIVTIGSPPAGSAVTGNTTVQATASDNVGIAGVQFLLDGNTLGSEDTTAPYAVAWNTTTLADGPHTLGAIARDAAGNRTTAAPITVNVANVSPPASECAPFGLTPFPGTTTFNNTVRAQMWIADNTWWGAFSDAASGIFFYRLSGSSFVKGPLIDTNFVAGGPDTLWNGRELFILVFQSGTLAKLYKYTHPSATSWTLVSGFPVNLPLAPSSLPTTGFATAIALQQDSTGRLWAVYPAGRDVHVIWSTSADHRTWDTTGLILASGIDELTNEAVTITHFDGNKIGVVWSNQALGEIGFRFHRDADPVTSWSPKELIDCCQGRGGVADDHLSLRAAPDGRVFLAAKDSLGNGNIHLYIRQLTGSWWPKTSLTSDPTAQPTRSHVVLDEENHHVYVFWHNSTTKSVYFVRTDANSGETFAEPCLFTNLGNNLTSTKQNVNGSTQLIAAATRENQVWASRLILASRTTAASSDAQPGAQEAAPESPAETPAAPGSPAPASAAAAAPSETPAPGFEVLAEGQLSTAELPANEGQWRWLRRQGVDTIVNLDDTPLDVGQHGFASFLWVPFQAGAVPSEELAERFLKFIQMADNQPAHISSAASDRRAIIVALMLYAVDGWTVGEALQEAQRLNHGVALSRQQVEWLLGWAGRYAPGHHRRTGVSQP